MQLKKQLLPPVVVLNRRDDNARKCKPTEYAVKNGVYVAGNGFSWWWLRSPYGYSVCFVYHDGDICYCSVSRDNNLVRSALSINL